MDQTAFRGALVLDSDLLNPTFPRGRLPQVEIRLVRITTCSVSVVKYAWVHPRISLTASQPLGVKGLNRDNLLNFQGYSSDCCVFSGNGLVLNLWEKMFSWNKCSCVIVLNRAMLGPISPFCAFLLWEGAIFTFFCLELGQDFIESDETLTHTFMSSSPFPRLSYWNACKDSVESSESPSRYPSLTPWLHAVYVVWSLRQATAHVRNG